MPSRQSWKLGEIVVVLVLAVALGVLWWGWTFINNLATPLHATGLDYLLGGVWYTGGTLIPFLVRRPGAAFVGEIAASLVESFITQWGITAFFWGAAQGAGCELVFLLFRYRRWDALSLTLAGIAAGVCNYILDFFYSHYAGLQSWVIAVQIGSVIVSGAVLGGLLAFVVGRGVRRTGALRTIVTGGEPG